MIYLIVIDELKACKIGFARDVERRIANLQAGCPLQYRMVATREGDVLLERAIHRSIAHHKLRNEWFSLNDEVLEAFFSEGLPHSGHAKIVRRGGTPEQVAERIGVSRHTVRAWIRRSSIPASHWHTFEVNGWATLLELANGAARKRAA